jgi:hypothetical protein
MKISALSAREYLEKPPACVSRRKFERALTQVKDVEPAERDAQ